MSSAPASHDFYSVFVDIGKEADPDQLCRAIEHIETPRHAIYMATCRIEMRKHEHVIERYCEKLTSIAEKFSSDQVAALLDALGKNDMTKGETEMSKVLRNKAQKQAFLS